MSTENIKAFQAAVLSDPALRTKLDAISLDNAEEAGRKIVALSREAGRPFTMEELFDSTGELQEHELENVAGGVMPVRNPKSPFEELIAGVYPTRDYPMK